MSEYERLQARLARGWNTWNTRSVLSHVLLPEGFALNLGLREYQGRQYLKEALIGRKRAEEEQLHPGPHAYDGSYTELNLKVWGNELTVCSATEGDDLVLLVTPVTTPGRKAPLLVVESGILWNRPGMLYREGDALVGRFAEREVRVYATQLSTVDPHIAAQTPYLAMALDRPVGISTGRPRSREEIEEIIRQSRQAHLARREPFGDLAEVYAAIQTCMAWDTIYEPEHQPRRLAGQPHLERRLGWLCAVRVGQLLCRVYGRGGRRRSDGKGYRLCQCGRDDTRDHRDRLRAQLRHGQRLLQPRPLRAAGGQPDGARALSPFRRALAPRGSLSPTCCAGTAAGMRSATIGACSAGARSPTSRCWMRTSSWPISTRCRARPGNRAWTTCRSTMTCPLIPQPT